jgi:hypothetical protein
MSKTNFEVDFANRDDVYHYSGSTFKTTSLASMSKTNFEVDFHTRSNYMVNLQKTRG